VYTCTFYVYNHHVSLFILQLVKTVHVFHVFLPSEYSLSYTS
jgi:hypothetical protein